jgi:predicted nucleic acid-binding protein
LNTYFDTSALVALYVPETFSAPARREARKAGQIPFALLHRLELGNAFRLLRGRDLIDEAELDQLNTQVAEDCDAQRLVDAQVDLFEVFDRALGLSSAHSQRLLCRSLDILHVAAALQISCDRFVSGDDRQLVLARTVGLEVVDIKQPTPTHRARRKRT